MSKKESIPDYIIELVDEVIAEYEGELDDSAETIDKLFDRAIEKYFKGQIDEAIKELDKNE